MRSANCWTKRFALVCALTMLVAACGGSGSDEAGTDPPPPPPPPTGTAEGLWSGTTSTGRTAVGLVLNDGTYWVLYSLVGNSSQIAGVVQGTGDSQNGNFSSSDGKDFNFEGAGILSLTFDADYVAKQSFDAAIEYSGTTVSLPATYNADYDSNPSLSIIAGAYSGYAVTNGGAEAATATISATGAVTGASASGCTFSGVAAPRTNGNVYNVSVTFAGAPCANGTSTVTGIGYWDAVSGTLYSAALNSARSNGFLFVAEKTANDPSESIIAAFTSAILASELGGFEEDESEIDSRLAAAGQYQSGNHVVEYKANLLNHVHQSFESQVGEIVALSTQQGLRRATVIPLVTKLGHDLTDYMNAFTEDHLSFAGGNVISSTASELSAGISQQRDDAIATLDSQIVWIF